MSGGRTYEPESERLISENPSLVNESIKWGTAFYTSQRKGLYHGKWNAFFEYVNNREQKLKNNQSQQRISK